MRWNRIRSSAIFIHEKNNCNFLNKINWSGPFTQLSINNFLQKFVRVFIKKITMNSIDIYNAMMTQHKNRDQNSNFFQPKKGKFFRNFFLHRFFSEIFSSSVFFREFFPIEISLQKLLKRFLWNLVWRNSLIEFRILSRNVVVNHISAKIGFLQTEKTA